MSASRAGAALAASASAAGSSVAANLPPLLRERQGLRLFISPDQIDFLQSAPIIVQHARNGGQVRRLRTIYYDTPDHILSGKGFSLRVQRQGKHFTQKLKQHGARQNPAPPMVWESLVTDETPDLACLADAPAEWISAPLLERLAAMPLQAVFETRIRRQIRRLAVSGALIDLSIDDGFIEAGSRQESLSELNLFLQAGEASVLYDLGMRLLELAPLRVSTVSKVARGYALASNTVIKAEKAGASTLTPAFAVDDMIAAILGGCQAHLQANQMVAENGSSPDGVHQMRVALRRLRSALSLLRRELPSSSMQTLGSEAKWAADQLGAARSWDVFLLTTLEAPSRWQSPGADFKALRQAAEIPRAAGYATVRNMIESARYGQFQLSLSQWIIRRGWRNEVDRDGLGVLAEPASMMATRVLARLHRKALKQGRHFKQLSAPERHELRITLKKLRYASEFFLPLFDETVQVPRHIKRLSSLQEALGQDHDAATTQPLLEELGALSRSPAVHQAIGLVTGWQTRDILANRETLAEQWLRFKGLRPFWTGPVHASS